MRKKYTNKQMDVQKAWLYLLNRYYAYKVYHQIDGSIKTWLCSLNLYDAHKIYNQIDGCTKSLTIFTKSLICI